MKSIVLKVKTYLHFLFVLYALISAKKLSGQTQRINLTDSSYIESFVDHFILKLNAEKQFEKYALSTSEGIRHIETNEGLKYSLSIDYEFIGIAIYLPYHNPNHIDGRNLTNTYGISYSVFLGPWVNRLSYAHTDGFMATSMHRSEFTPLNIKQYGGAIAYLLNPNFSLRNLIYQNEWQKRSAASFVPTLEYTYAHATKDHASIFPKRQLTIEFTMAYYGTYVIQSHWFIAVGILPLMGVRLDQKENTALRKQWTQGIKSQLQLGYSSQSFIAGITMNSHFQQDLQLHLNHRQYEFNHIKAYVGYRFKAPKWAKNSMKKLGM